MAHRIATVLAVLAACAVSSPPPATPAPVTQPDHAAHHAAPDAGVSPADAPAADASGPAPVTQDPKAELLAAETAAWDAAKPVFDQWCASCHTTGHRKATKKKLDHFNFTSYPPTGHHAATIGFTIRDVLGLSGKKPTMPDNQPGAVKGDDLAKIKAWTDAWVAADQAGAHPSGAHVHGHH